MKYILLLKSILNRFKTNCYFYERNCILEYYAGADEVLSPLNYLQVAFLTEVFLTNRNNLYLLVLALRFIFN